jgi:hypothetical protein
MAEPIPPKNDVVFSAVAFTADSVFWYLQNRKKKIETLYIIIIIITH